MLRFPHSVHGLSATIPIGFALVCAGSSGCGSSGVAASGDPSQEIGSVTPPNGGGKSDAGGGNPSSPTGGDSGASTPAADSSTSDTGPGAVSTQGPGCALTNPAFCDTFDAPAGIGNRSGQLNGTIWGVSHFNGDQNFSSPALAWVPAAVQACGQTVNPDTPPGELVVCNGQLAEASNDLQSVSSTAMYVKQPFDFAGRTGKVTFDVSNDSQGSHAAWPEFWISDKPIPAPFTHEALGTGNAPLPKDGFGIRFAANCAPGQGPNCGPKCAANNTQTVVTVDSALTVSNYIDNDSFSGGSLKVVNDDCVTESTGPGDLNHFEIDVSQNQIDIYGTDAGTTTPLKHLATIPNANLTLTRGLVWIEDVHYNADKFNTQRIHTFTWDNVGFDGPVLPRDLAYDALDAVTPNGDGTFSLGWFTPASGSTDVTVPGITQASIDSAASGLLTFSFWLEATNPTLNYAINGNQHSMPWPFPTQGGFSARTLGVSVPLSEVVPGTNTVTFSTESSYAINVMNVDLIMVGAGGVQQ